MSTKKVGMAVAMAAAIGGLVVGGAALADAATKTSATGSSSTTEGPTGTSGSRAGAGHGASSDTPVTGEELAKVSAAVTAKDSAVTVTSVRKDPDGSYDVFGTKAGAQVMLEVSADLKTVSQGVAGGRHGGGHGGGHGDESHTDSGSTAATATPSGASA